MRMRGWHLPLLTVAIGVGLAGAPLVGAQSAAPPPQGQPGARGWVRAGPPRGAAHPPPPPPQGQPGEPRHGVTGAITAVSTGTIEITDRDGKAVTVKLTPATRILQP